MEQLIAQARKQFDDILFYVQGQAQDQQLNEVEKGIFLRSIEVRYGVAFGIFSTERRWA